MMNELNGLEILALFQAFEEFTDRYPLSANVLDKIVVKYTKISNALDVVIDLKD